MPLVLSFLDIDVIKFGHLHQPLFITSFAYRKYAIFRGHYARLNEARNLAHFQISHPTTPLNISSNSALVPMSAIAKTYHYALLCKYRNFNVSITLTLVAL